MDVVISDIAICFIIFGVVFNELSELAIMFTTSIDFGFGTNCKPFASTSYYFLVNILLDLLITFVMSILLYFPLYVAGISRF
ncbi:unnamed protein product, partial [Rotaria sp. Silwood2]